MSETQTPAPSEQAAQTRSAEGATPSMRQYFETKAAHPDALLFFRMGDFYEMFFEDAVAAAGALDIALTKRGKHRGEDIPMCGVPAHSAERYLADLTRSGFAVAICEQMENPADARKRGSKAVVRREVVRLVTPGTLTEDTLLDARASNYLVAYSAARGEAALSWVEMSTGEFAVTTTDEGSLASELARLAPSEIVVSDRAYQGWTEDAETAGPLPLFESVASVAPIAASSFDSLSAEKRLRANFGVDDLGGFGSFSRVELSALGAALEYLALTQRGALPHLDPPRRIETDGAMQIDAATRRNLELVEAVGGGRQGSLVSTIDRTVTGAGARALTERLSAPLTDVAQIARRLDAVTLFRETPELTEKLRARLREVPDIARALSRLSLGRAGPRDLAAMRSGLAAAAAIARLLGGYHDLPDDIAEAAQALTGHEALADRLGKAVIDEPPLLARDGGFIRAGFNAPLDEHRGLRDDSRRVIRDLEAGLKRETGIGALKVKHNNVLGYFIEVPGTHGEKLIGTDQFVHRQTLASAARFTTSDLAELDGKIARAGALAIEAETAIFEDLRRAVVDRAAQISATARALAALDVAAALGDLAASEGWTRPRVDRGTEFEIVAGRHPVVEMALRRDGETFVANDCGLSQARLWLLTGPNMAGKSTFLRQNALIAVLAQTGSYVPAASAHIGVVDRLFSRVGASDDLARGRSTFMVEMVETAAILNLAGPKALVILDEIGRGTATFDGLSIAWATLEHLHDVNRCRGLFATHYHELTELAARLDGARNAAMKVAEWEGELVFLHEVEPGAATRSYGVQVARKAGLPPSVVARARDVLERLETGDARGGEGRIRALLDDLPLFAAAQDTAQPPPSTASELEAALADIDPDELTPKGALEAIYALKRITIS